MTATPADIEPPTDATETPPDGEQPAPMTLTQAMTVFLLGKGLSHQQIAESVGSNWRSVYRWAEGAKPLDVYTKGLQALAEKHGFEMPAPETAAAP